MHHCRVNVNGPREAADTLIAELCAAGARPVDERCLVTTSAAGTDLWEQLSSRHPLVVIGLECFEEFGDDFLQAHIENGRMTVMARNGVLPEDWGGLYDDEGERISEELVRGAAMEVLAAQKRQPPRSPEGSLDVAMSMGKLLGRFCTRTEASALGEPTREALDAVTELALLALVVSAYDSVRSDAEREFQLALRLTQSMVHAGRDEVFDRPGGACWTEWLELLLASASNIVDAACNCCIDRTGEAHAFGAEQYGTPDEHLEYEGRALLTTCLQTLALFADGGRRSAPAVTA
ncbi:MAG: hypothetical protein ACXVRH_01825 [Thermoleophilaceae bacterium]